MQYMRKSFSTIALALISAMTLTACGGGSSTPEESFIEVKSKSSSDLELQLELVKSVISHKVAVRDASAKRAETEARNSKIKEILARKQDASLENLSVEELQKMINS